MESIEPKKESIREISQRLGIPLVDHGLPIDIVRPAPFWDDSMHCGAKCDAAFDTTTEKYECGWRHWCPWCGDCEYCYDEGPHEWD